jgi:hypothetical protein
VRLPHFGIARRSAGRRSGESLTRLAGCVSVWHLCLRACACACACASACACACAYDCGCVLAVRAHCEMAGAQIRPTPSGMYVYL